MLILVAKGIYFSLMDQFNIAIPASSLFSFILYVKEPFPFHLWLPHSLGLPVSRAVNI